MDRSLTQNSKKADTLQGKEYPPVCQVKEIAGIIKADSVHTELLSPARFLPAFRLNPIHIFIGKKDTY